MPCASTSMVRNQVRYFRGKPQWTSCMLWQGCPRPGMQLDPTGYWQHIRSFFSIKVCIAITNTLVSINAYLQKQSQSSMSNLQSHRRAHCIKPRRFSDASPAFKADFSTWFSNQVEHRWVAKMIMLAQSAPSLDCHGADGCPERVSVVTKSLSWAVSQPAMARLSVHER